MPYMFVKAVSVIKLHNSGLFLNVNIQWEGEGALSRRRS